MTTSVEVPPVDSGRSLRFAAIGLVMVTAAASWLLGGLLGFRVQAAFGALCFIALIAACSPNLRLVNWRTVGWGMALQFGFALIILKLEVGGRRPGYEVFNAIGRGVSQFLQFTDLGSQFVFGVLAKPDIMGKVFGPADALVFAFVALPTIIFVSSFFTVLYYFGILQFVVRLMARAMMRLMRTSGAETLSATANVFMGQTEAPIIVKPFVPRMTQSELLAMMVGGMATISGGVMAVYIALGADPVAILTTSVMAAPCGLYLSKMLLPELEQPETLGNAQVNVEKLHVNVIDAAASGASDGLTLALNVAGMLIAFLAFIALFNFILGAIRPGLTLAGVFAVIFAPVAFLMGSASAHISWRPTR
jgi:CNT family concentrative nucleoside transporter